MMTVQQEAHAGMFVRRAIELVLALGVLMLGVAFLLFDTAWQHPLYTLLGSIAPQRAWGTLFTVLGSVRAMVVIVNGFWPLSPVARLSLSIATLVVAWLPLAMTALAYFRPFLLGAEDLGGGGLLPDLVLVGIAVMTEGLCMYALAALRAARVHQTGMDSGVAAHDR